MGLDVLLDSASQLASDRHQFVLYVAGAGPEEGSLREKARRSAAASNVKFMGAITDDQAALAYQAADVFVLPSASLECFGIIALEAMSFGCPVIAARVGAIPEILGEILPHCLYDTPKGLTDLLAAHITSRLTVPSPRDLEEYAHGRYAFKELSKAYLALVDPEARIT